MKKVLLLCSSHNDLGLINGLRKMGYYIYSTGSIPGLIGEKYVDEYIQADYSDKEKILDIAKKLEINSICACCNDFGVYTAAYVAEKMGLEGYDSYETTLLLNNKDLFKKFALSNGIITPNSVAFDDFNRALEYCETVELPIIVKAVDLSAGNGIKKVEKKDELIPALKNAFGKSRVKRILIEQYVEGEQHGFCTFLVDKKVVASCSNDEYSIINPYRVEIDTFPARGIEKCEKTLIQQIEKIATLLNLKDGIFHLQYIDNEEGPHIIEVMRRAIGNMYAVPASALCGFDWDYWESRALTGNDCGGIPRSIPKDGFFAYKTMLASKNGKVAKIQIPDRYNKYLIGKCVIKAVGDIIDNYISQPIGLLFLRFSTQEEMLDFLISDYKNDTVIVE